MLLLSTRYRRSRCSLSCSGAPNPPMPVNRGRSRHLVGAPRLTDRAGGWVGRHATTRSRDLYSIARSLCKAKQQHRRFSPRSASCAQPCTQVHVTTVHRSPSRADRLRDGQDEARWAARSRPRRAACRPGAAPNAALFPIQAASFRRTRARRSGMADASPMASQPTSLGTVTPGTHDARALSRLPSIRSYSMTRRR